MDIKQQFGKKLRTAREKRELSQEALAEKTNRSRSSILGYEAGKRLPPIEDLPLLAEVLNVPVAYFFQMEGFVTPEQARASELIAALPPVFQRAILNLMEQAIAIAARFEQVHPVEVAGFKGRGIEYMVMEYLRGIAAYSEDVRQSYEPQDGDITVTTEDRVIHFEIHVELLDKAKEAKRRQLLFSHRAEED